MFGSAYPHTDPHKKNIFHENYRFLFFSVQRTKYISTYLGIDTLPTYIIYTVRSLLVIQKNLCAPVCLKYVSDERTPVRLCSDQGFDCVNKMYGQADRTNTIYLPHTADGSNYINNCIGFRTLPLYSFFIVVS
jgi:hypothetical protein